MRLIYIYHSGFALETESSTIIFDYYQDPGSVIPSILERDVPIYVFSSHFHADHFVPEILTWREKRQNIHYIFSKDILRQKRAFLSDGTYLVKGEVYQDDLVKVKAYGSTDSGVSWLVETEGKTIFHAGDLNNWHWADECPPEEARQYEKAYLGELKDIVKDINAVDVAMFPVDNRLGTDYARGAKQFLDAIHTGLFVPMHFTAGGFGPALDFKKEAESREARFFSIQREGDSITF